MIKTDYSAQIEYWPIRSHFVLSRETKTESVVVTVNLMRNGYHGSGECVPLKRYEQTPQGELEKIQQWLAQGHEWDRQVLIDTMPACPARFALDTAMWQLEAAEHNMPLWQYAGLDSCPAALPTAFTVSGADPETQAKQAAERQDFRWIKMKLLGDGLDQARLSAVHEAVPHMDLIVDANEGLSDVLLERLLPVFQSCNVVLIEQPLPVGQDDFLRDMQTVIPLAADESCHIVDDLHALVGKYQVVNLKLDKTGGLTHALEIKKQAHKMGFRIMIGCMASTGLSIFPALLLAQNTDFIDLDGALLLEKDRDNSKVFYDSGKVFMLE